MNPSPCSPWRLSDRCDPAALPLADRHYNRQKPGTPKFGPPARSFALITEDRSSLWLSSWPFPEFVMHEWAGAWVNSLFRREGGAHRASDLIRWAVAHTRAHWPTVPDLGMVTFVDASKIQEKPGRYRTQGVGWCYLKAGWKHVGFTKTEHLWVFQQLPGEMPDPSLVPGGQLSLFEVAS